MVEVKFDVAREYVEKFIQLGIKFGRGYSKRAIAQNMFEERPDLFTSCEHARVTVRRVTNCDGNRKTRGGDDLARRLALIEDGLIELPNITPYVIPEKYKKSLWIADLHSRFCDKKSLTIAIEYGIKHKCDSVVINGDFMDYYQNSRFDNNPLTLEGFYTENDWGISVLELLQSTFGQVFLKSGNHDLRRELKIQKMALQMPELISMPTYKECLSFNKSRVEFIEDYRIIKFGKLSGIHGHEYQGGGGIHVAYNRLNKAKDNIISAHSHIAQSDLQTTIDGSVIVSVTLGCLCDIHPRYNPMNQWTQGFAVIERCDNGNFMIDNRVIIEGKAYPR